MTERETNHHLPITAIEASAPKAQWGFLIPTCFIDTQSAPALVGVEPEQKYIRAFFNGRAG